MSPGLPTGSELVALAAVAARLWAILRVQPLWSAALGRSWELAAPLLAVVLAPLMVDPSQTRSSPLGDGSMALAVLFAGEFLLGSMLGFVAALPSYGLLGAAGATGHSLRVSAGVWQASLAALCLAMAFALDLQRPLLLALRGTFELWPLGGGSPGVDAEQLALVAALGIGLPALLGQMLWLALALATPVLLTSLIVDLAIAVVPTGEQHLTAASDPLRSLLAFSAALIALGASWAAYPGSWARVVLPFEVTALP